jgi:D-alanyl-D-alanine carboxypeptidase
MRFGIGSLSKSFVAAAILQLRDEGKLSLEDTVGQWLPALPNVTNTITIRQLLNHTSGLYNYTENQDWLNSMIEDPDHRYAVLDVFSYVGKPYASPGKVYHYSNTGYLLLGLIIEAASGQSLMTEYRKRFLAPLNLRSAYLEAVEPPTGELPHYYSGFNPSRNLEDISSISRLTYYSQNWAAGAIFANVGDAVRWFHALWSGSLLSAEALQDMTRWTSVSGTTRYGMAVLSLSTSRGEFYAHEGHVPGFHTFAGYSPSLKTTVVLFFNGDNEIEASWRQLIAAL